MQTKTTDMINNFLIFLLGSKESFEVNELLG